MTQHTTIKDAFGPGTFVDTTAIDVPTDAHRLLRQLVNISPNIGVSPEELDLVDFVGEDLSIIPGPLKSQAYVSQVLYCVCNHQHLLTGWRIDSQLRFKHYRLYWYDKSVLSEESTRAASRSIQMHPDCIQPPWPWALSTAKLSTRLTT